MSGAIVLVRGLAVVLLLTASAALPAPPVEADAAAAVRAVIGSYHAALRKGDAPAALALLTSDALVLEAGGIETLKEYQSAHLAADIEFSQAVPQTQTPVQVTVHGDVAWASTLSEASGKFRGRDVRTRGAELMVLSRESSGWRIRAIHWSSRPR